MKVAFLVFCLLLLILLVADYHGLLGVKESSYVEYFNVEFNAEDSVTGDKVENFVANCTRRGSRNACAIEQGWNKDSRLIKFGVVRRLEKSWLFTLRDSVVGADDVNVSIMFIHPDYERHTETYTMRDLMTLQDQHVTIVLTKQTLAKKENNKNE